MSSSLYIINDIFDAPSDRHHPEKQFRPIASGALPVKVAILGSGSLLAASVWLAAWLGTSFLVLCAAYWALILGYCLGLKGVIVLDAMIIAFGFVLRVIGGAIAVDVKPTHWLIVCAFLLALYLAFAKRRQELLLLSDQATSHRQVLNSYSVDYLNQVNNILLGATIVCYALYTVAPETVARFGTDRLIYGSVFVVYGLLRYMNLLQNPTNGGDPGKLLIKDKPLLLAVLGWMVYNLVIIYNSSLLVPSITYETFGIIIIESFARKTPVIVHNLGALPEVVQDSAGGFVYDSEEELLAAINRLAGSPQLRREMGQNGYDAFIKWWCREAHLEMYFGFLRKAAMKRLGRVPWKTDDLPGMIRDHLGEQEHRSRITGSSPNH